MDPTDTGPPLTAEDVTQILGQLEDVEDEYQKLAFLTTPKMLCPECGGAGMVASGSLGDSPCAGCAGMRMVDQPAAEPPFAMPDFPALRQTLVAYSDHLLGPDAMTKERWEKLPPKPDLEKVLRLSGVAELRSELRRLADKTPKATLPQLPAAKKRRGEAGEFDDDELDDIVDAEYEDK